jgi:hypothetical protein
VSEFLNQWNIAIRMLQRVKEAWHTEFDSNNPDWNIEQALWDEYGRWAIVVETFDEMSNI